MYPGKPGYCYLFFNMSQYCEIRIASLGNSFQIKTKADDVVDTDTETIWEEPGFNLLTSLFECSEFWIILFEICI